jgi:glycosyltransferase involved in cell wall biosynthesis
VGDIAARVAGVPGCAVVDADPDALARALQAAIATPRSDEGRRRVEPLALTRVAEQILGVYELVTRRR